MTLKSDPEDLLVLLWPEDGMGVWRMVTGPKSLLSGAVFTAEARSITSNPASVKSAC